MNLTNINNCLTFFNTWGTAKGETPAFQELNNQLEKYAGLFSKEILGNTTYTKWLFAKARSVDKGEYDSIMLETIAILIGRCKKKVMYFNSEEEFDSYIYLTLFGKEGKGGIVGLRRNDNRSPIKLLTEREKKYRKDKNKREAKKQGITSEAITKEKSTLDIEATVMIDELDASYNEESIIQEGTSDINEALELNFDQDRNGNSGGNNPIENYADQEIADSRVVNDMKISLEGFGETVAGLLYKIKKDLSEEDEILERKLAWLYGENHSNMLYEKVGLFTDPLVLRHDTVTSIRYMYWKN